MSKYNGYDRSRLDKMVGDTDNPFRVSDFVLEWVVLLQGLMAGAITILDMKEVVSVSQTEWNFIFGLLIAVNLILMSGVMRRLRQGD